MNQNVYIGSRYVPKLFINPNDGSNEWINTIEFESLTVVSNQGNSYTSRQKVPIGIDISNTLFWVKTSDYNAQVAIYEQHVRDYHQYVIDQIGIINQDNSDFQTTVNQSNNAFQNSIDTKLLNTIYFVTPQLFGAKGDGITDDTIAIQTMIDNSPNTTIIFPKGTYLVSSPIITSANNAQNVNIHFSDYAIVKASNTFVGESLFAIGGKNYDSYSHFGVNSAHTIKGYGTLDCNSKCSGISFNCVAFSKFCDMNIINATDYGIKVLNGSNSGSMDMTIDNVQVNGTLKDNSTAVIIDAYDNHINNVRTHGFIVGFKLLKGGNYLTDCHPLGSVITDQTLFEKQIAFYVGECGDNTFTNCYSDNFSIGFYFTYANWKNVLINPYFFWFNDDTFKHICFSCPNDRFSIDIQSPQITFPPHGTNIILQAPLTAQNTLTMHNRKGSIKDLMLDSSAYSRMSYPVSDSGLLSCYNKENDFSIRYESDYMLNNLYYPIVELSWARNDVNVLDIDLFAESNFHLEASCTFSSNGFAIPKVKNLVNYTGGTVNLALANYFIGSDGFYHATLYIKFVNVQYSVSATSVYLKTSPCASFYRVPMDAYTILGNNSLTTLNNQIASDVVVSVS